MRQTRITCIIRTSPRTTGVSLFRKKHGSAVLRIRFVDTDGEREREKDEDEEEEKEGQEFDRGSFPIFVHSSTEPKERGGPRARRWRVINGRDSI